MATLDQALIDAVVGLPTTGGLCYLVKHLAAAVAAMWGSFWENRADVIRAKTEHELAMAQIGTPTSATPPTPPPKPSPSGGAPTPRPQVASLRAHR